MIQAVAFAVKVEYRTNIMSGCHESKLFLKATYYAVTSQVCAKKAKIFTPRRTQSAQRKTLRA
jgi:hypothetical protein